MSDVFQEQATPGTLFTVSAPSGAGKTSLVKALVAQEKGVLVSVSHTTRKQRPNERDGVNYNFVAEQEFKQMVAEQAFLEHAEVFGNHYGTSKAWVVEALQSGNNVILEIDWQGAEQVRQWALSNEIFCHGIFILPPSMATLRERLDDRGQDDAQVIERRMQAAVAEIAQYASADYLLVNDDFDEALEQMRAIIQASGLEQAKQRLRYRYLLDELLG